MTSSLTLVALSQAEVDAGILRGEIAGAGVNLTHELPPVRAVLAVTTEPGANPLSFTSSQWPVAPVFRSRISRPADRVDRDVEVPVVVVVGCGQAAAVAALTGG